VLPLYQRLVAASAAELMHGASETEAARAETTRWDHSKEEARQGILVERDQSGGSVREGFLIDD